jgi:hypothetical protein
LAYSQIDEIPVSHLTQKENCRKVTFISEAILQIIKPLKMVLCSSCDGVPLKFKKKNGQASSLTECLAQYRPLLKFAGQYL